MADPSLTPAMRHELIRAAIYHSGDWQGTAAQARKLIPAGLIGRLSPRSRQYRLTAAGMELGKRLARLDVAEAQHRMEAKGLRYQRHSADRLF